MLTESGDVYDTTLTGGRLGMLVFGQQDVIWSRLEARGVDRSVGILTLRRKTRKNFKERSGMFKSFRWAIVYYTLLYLHLSHSF